MDEGEALEAGLLPALEKGLKDRTKSSFLENPLLLSIFIATYKSSPDIPSKKHLFYEAVFEALYTRHDALTKTGFIRKKHISDKDEFMQFMQHFSSITYWEEEYNWRKEELLERIKQVKGRASLQFNNDELIQDLTVSVPLWTEDEGEYAFSHRSFQEYFTCLYIKNHLNKKDFYTQILKDIKNEYAPREVEHLLNLLEEIDQVAYYKYFYIPLFEEYAKRLPENFTDFLNNNIKFVYPLGTAKQLVEKLMETPSFQSYKNNAGTLTEAREMAREMAMEMARETKKGPTTKHPDKEPYICHVFFLSFVTTSTPFKFSGLPLIKGRILSKILSGTMTLYDEPIITFIEQNTTSGTWIPLADIPQEVKQLWEESKCIDAYKAHRDDIIKKIDKAKKVVDKAEQNKGKSLADY